MGSTILWSRRESIAFCPSLQVHTGSVFPLSFSCFQVPSPITVHMGVNDNWQGDPITYSNCHFPRGLVKRHAVLCPLSPHNCASSQISETRWKTSRCSAQDARCNKSHQERNHSYLTKSVSLVWVTAAFSIVRPARRGAELRVVKQTHRYFAFWNPACKL